MPKSRRQSKLKNTSNFWISWLMMVLGSFLLFVSLIFQFVLNTPLQTPDSIPEIKSEQNFHQVPKSISIDTLAQVFDLQPGIYENGLWSVSETTPSYLVQSAKPGEKGNIIIYGHNRAGIFKDLNKVKIKDKIILNTSDSTYEYQVQDIAIVFPSETSYLQQTETEILTIYTCYGFLDSKRLVIQAKPLTV